MSVGELVRRTRTASYIAKFGSPEYPRLIENEFTFTRLARLCRLNVSETRIQKGALVVNKVRSHVFDRATKRVQRIHVEDMLQVMDRFPNSKYTLEFDDLLGMAMQQLGVSKRWVCSMLSNFTFSAISSVTETCMRRTLALFVTGPMDNGVSLRCTTSCPHCHIGA